MAKYFSLSYHDVNTGNGESSNYRMILRCEAIKLHLILVPFDGIEPRCPELVITAQLDLAPDIGQIGHVDLGNPQTEGHCTKAKGSEWRHEINRECR